ncbi:MAG: TOMM precursor leader peptide-binding protein, partial [Ardenticatenaceae bacterium]
SEGVFLLSEKAYFLLRGTAYILLAPLLNGQHTVEEIIDLLEGQLSAAEVYYAVELLRRKGYVVHATTSMPTHEAAFWQMLDVSPEVVVKRLEEKTVSVVSFGQIDPAPFKTMLNSLGVRVGDNAEQAVVLTDDYLQPGLQTFNEEAVSSQRPWMLLKPVGSTLWIGPLFIPGQTACWDCLAHRLQGHRKIERYLQQRKGGGSFPFSFSVLPSTLQTALGIAATESVKWLVTGKNEALENKVVTLNTLSLQKRDHVLIRRLQCACCGDPRLGVPSTPVVLSSQAKYFTSDGGHRTLSPEETFQKLEHHISPITGIVSLLQEYEYSQQTNGLITSYYAMHHFVESKDELAFWRAGLRKAAGGKGKSKIQAKVSALCEAIERYSGVFQGDEVRLRAKLKELGDAAIHPNACMLFSSRQVEHGEQTKNWRVPEAFDEEMAIEWSPVWSLTVNKPRYLPTAYCYYGYSEQLNIQFTYADSNGCAAGNCKEEAILQGFMEVVERDSVALWWYNRLKKPAVALESFDDPYGQQLQHYYKTLQRDLWVLDITSDFNIPTFVAISRRHDKEEEDIILGFGAHFDPQIALLRALTELNQILPNMLSGSKDDQDPTQREIIKWCKSATIANQPYLVPDEKMAPKVQADYAKQWTDDLHTDVMTCVRIAKEKGLETLVLDQTRPDLGLHVVKVIVPGMRLFWRRLAPGRLYDVPVQMGWLMEPLMEEQLNPERMVF